MPSESTKLRINDRNIAITKEKGLDLESNYFKEQEEGQPDYDDSCENWNFYTMDIVQ